MARNRVDGPKIKANQRKSRFRWKFFLRITSSYAKASYSAKATKDGMADRQESPD
jgi:hypothetical protein